MRLNTCGELSAFVCLGNSTVIRDEHDFINHVNYIHYNPLHHGLVLSPKDWQYSSFHRYVKHGVYDVD